MIYWLVKRLFQAVMVMLVMTVLVFIGLHMIGDPIAILISPEATQADRVAAIASLGLDKPLWEQYFIFLGGLTQGDVGRSFIFNEPALSLILSRMPATLELTMTAVLMSLVIGLPLGMLAGMKPDSFLSRTILAGSIVGFSVPTFWFGLILIMTFSVNLGWLPSSGRGDTVSLFGTEWSFLTLDGLEHLLMPAVTLSLFNIALVIRLVRSGVQEVKMMDFIKFARAKGLTEKRIVSVHILKNIMIPVVTVVGIDFASTFAFSIVTETVFTWPGMGRLIIDSINLLDRPVIVAYLMLVAFIFVLVNLIVDIAYMFLDPRVRLEAI